ncbi:hypothetical protein BLSTO_06079 [Blastocystis sp. subtype 1]
METPSKEPNRSLPWRPLLLNSGGPRRVARSTLDGDFRDNRETVNPSLPPPRNDKTLTSRKRPASTFQQEIKRSSLDDTPPSNSPSRIGSSLRAFRSESRRSSSQSSKSSLSGEVNALLLPPSTPPTPKNLQDKIVMNGKEYIILQKIGKGGSCVVYRVINESNEVLALKCVNLDGVSPTQYTDYVNEVKLLETLRGSPGIIYLIDYELNTSENMLYILMEYGESDLKTYLLDSQSRNCPLDSNFIRLIWQQMLTAVSAIHHHNIIHSDLKPANFLFVKGVLKLIDFGIAQSMAAESTSVLRESQIGTINYISPEALLDEEDAEGHKHIRVGCSGAF